MGCLIDGGNFLSLNLMCLRSIPCQHFASWRFFSMLSTSGWILNATIKSSLQERPWFQFISWHGAAKNFEFDQKVGVGFLPLSAENSFSSNFSNASTSLDRPFSGMVALTPCISFDYIIYLFLVTWRSIRFPEQISTFRGWVTSLDPIVASC